MYTSQQIIFSDTNLTIRYMNVNDLAEVMGWCEEEGWNIAKNDAAIYHRIDPKGHLLFLKNDDPVGAISIMRHTKNFMTLGPFIVKKEYRYQGYGTQIWQSAMALIQDNPTITLHAVSLQIPRYQKQGFESQYINRGYTMTSSLSREKEAFSEIRPITSEWLPAIIHYDKTIFGISRKKLLTEVLKLPYVYGVLLDNGGQVTGFGLIRPCLDGYRLGPLFANTLEHAKQIFSYLINMVDEKKIIIDIPNKNRFSTLFVEYFSLNPISQGETNTMLKGETIEQNLDKNYGVFSLEMG